MALKGRAMQADISDLAPDFEVPVLIGGVKKRFHLREELKRKNVVLAFYPQNWQEASAKQLTTYQEQRAKFGDLQAQIVGISVDSIMNTTSWEREIGPFDFPICSDFWPHGEVSRAYGILREQDPFRGSSERAIFVISQSGKIAFRKIYPLDVVVPVDETLAALRVI